MEGAVVVLLELDDDESLVFVEVLLDDGLEDPPLDPRLEGEE